jgi:hypothetical protein
MQIASFLAISRAGRARAFGVGRVVAAALAQIRWGHANATAEGAIETGEIAKPSYNGDDADVQAAKSGIGEHFLRARRALVRPEL